MIQTLKSGNTNCYLIKIGKAYALIDAGTALDRNFLSKLQAIVPLDQIEIVILTHGYYDHIGHATKLQKDYGSKIAIHQKDFDKAATGAMDFPKARGLFSNCIRNTTMKEMKHAKFIPFNADIVILGKEQILHYPQIEIIELPGHTPGSIGVVWENNLFAGDLVMNMPIPSKSWFAEDFYLLQHSFKKVEKREFKRVYPGHGSSFSSKWLNHI